MKLLKKIGFKSIEFIFIFKKMFLTLLKLNNDINDNTIFFIIGSGRNGSTLLARLLNNHNDIFLPPEQFALPYTISDWQISLFRTWNTYYKKQLKRYLSNNQNWILNKDDFCVIDQQLKTTDKRNRNPRTIFKLIFQVYSNKYSYNKKIFGDHSPITTVFYKYIYYEFSKDKYIFIIRHPFDVILSYSKMQNNPANDPIYACWKWNNSIKAYDFFKKKKCKLLMLKYEDLVTNPEIALKNIQKFINVEFQILTQLKGNELAKDHLGTKNLSHHQKIYQPIDSKSVNKWKKELDPEIILKTRNIIEKNALRFGYDLS